MIIRRIIISLIATLSVSLVWAQGNKSIFKWNSEVHDFGAFNEDVGSVTCHFIGVNESTDTAAIVFLSASCGCTQPTADKKIIPPGDSVNITVVYDPTNRPGPFTKKVTVGGSPSFRYNFEIKGSVISSTKRMKTVYPNEIASLYRLSDKAVSYGSVREDRSATSTVHGINNTEETVVPTISTIPSWLDVAVSPDTVSPGGTFTISLVADAPKVGQLGVTMDTLSLSSTAHPDLIGKLPVSIILMENFPEMTSEQLEHAPYLTIKQTKLEIEEPINPVSTTPIILKSSILNEGYEPLIIRRAYTFTPGIEIKLPEDPIDPDVEKEFEIIITPSLLPTDQTDLRARVSVIANSPINPSVDIKIIGTIDR